MTTLSIADAGTKRDQQTAARALHALAELASGTHHVSIGTRQLRVSNLDKVLYPQTGFTKPDLLTAYARLGPVLVAHARRRPLTMKRYPDGVEQEFFFHKRAPEHHPDWVHVTKPIGDQRVEYAMLDDVPTLLWVANLAAIELHVLLAEAREVNRPTAMVFDLDPGEGACIIECCEVAAIIRETFSDLGLSCFAKTSGSKGVQVYVPLNRAEITYEQTKPFAKAMAELLEREHPDLIVSKQRKALRRGKVLIDWSQNDPSKTTICAYSIRARENPRVSTPVTWDEVTATAAGSDQHALRFETDDVIDRIDRHGDLFAPVLTKRQRLPHLG